MTDSERNERLDDLIREMYGSDEVKIMGLTFDPARIIFEIDPIAYRCMIADYEIDDDEEDTYEECPCCVDYSWMSDEEEEESE